jgi:hypothetical protein
MAEPSGTSKHRDFFISDGLNPLMLEKKTSISQTGREYTTEGKNCTSLQVPLHDVSVLLRNG